MKRVITTERIPIKLWLDEVDAGTLIQAKNLANLPFALNWIAIMPDAHLGYGMPIGGVMATDGVIVPNAVGVDIGCGMAASRLSLTEIDKESIEKIIGQVKNRIPVGFEHNQTAQEWEGFDEAPDIPVVQRNLASARKQLGTLGGGNHFIEIQAGSDGHIWLMVHSGSRNYGLKTANEYHKKAQQLCQRWHSDIPDRDLSFLPIESDGGGEYFAAMNFCLKFAQANRALMMKKLLDIPVGGWCSKGRKAEDGPIDKKYPLQETTSGNYRVRTGLNVKDSDGTLIFTIGKTAPLKDLYDKINDELFNDML